MTSSDPAHDPNAWMYIEGPARRALRRRLLLRREHLATAAAEHTAHDQAGADLLWQAADAIAARLRDVFPDTWSEQHENWAATDAARIHTAGDPRPIDCRLCSLTRHRDGSAAA